MNNSLRLAIMILAGSLVLFGCRPTEARGEVPGLSSAYSDLSLYWNTLAASIGIQPGAGGVSQWSLSYDRQGNVLFSALMISVDAGPDQVDRYSILQQGGKTASWERRRISGAVPAKALLDELDAIGLRNLEGNLAIAPPIQFSFRAESETVAYGAPMHPRIVLAGQILPTASEEVTMQSSHGWLQLKPATSAKESTSATAAYPGDSPPLILIGVGCSQLAEKPGVWRCPAAP